MFQSLKYFLSGFKRSLATCKHHSGLSKADQENYKQWINQKIYLNWSPLLFKAYHFDKAGIRPDFKLERIQQPGKNGVIFSYDDRIGDKNFYFYYEYLKDRVLKLGYRLHSADVRNCRKNGFAETIHKYYLTPPPTCLKESVLCNQLYGTISIDFILIDNNPGFIRIMACSCQSSAFSKPLSFDELLAYLMEHSS